MRPTGMYKSHDLMTIFLGLLNSDLGQFSMVKIIVIGRFSCFTDGSKLILCAEQ